MPETVLTVLSKIENATVDAPHGAFKKNFDPNQKNYEAVQAVIATKVTPLHFLDSITQEEYDSLLKAIEKRLKEAQDPNAKSRAAEMMSSFNRKIRG